MMPDDLPVNLPHVLQAVEQVFRMYEQAFLNNDLSVLDQLFWHSPHVVRLGMTETLYGIEAIRQFRQNRDAQNIARVLYNTRITTFGDDFAVTVTEFERIGEAGGRQTQTWVRFAVGWRIVAAHISKSP